MIRGVNKQGKNCFLYIVRILSINENLKREPSYKGRDETQEEAQPWNKPCKQIHHLRLYLSHLLSLVHTRRYVTHVGVDESLFCVHWTQTECQPHLIHHDHLIY